MSDADDTLRDVLKDFRAATRREAASDFVRLLIRQGLGPLGRLSGRAFAAHVAGGILATEPTSVSLEEVAALDEPSPAGPCPGCEARRTAGILRSAGWAETPQGWRAGSAASLPLAEAYAELRRQMRIDP